MPGFSHWDVLNTNVAPCKMVPRFMSRRIGLSTFRCTCCEQAHMGPGSLLLECNETYYVPSAMITFYRKKKMSPI